MTDWYVRTVYSSELTFHGECLLAKVISFNDEHPRWKGGEHTYTALLFDNRGDILDSAHFSDESEAIGRAQMMLGAEIERMVEGKTA